MKAHRFSLLIIAAAAAITLGACSSVSVVQRRATPTLRELPHPMPVTASVAVIYPHGLAGEARTRSSMTYRWVVPIGQESMTMFEAVWPRLFTRVVPPAGQAPEATGPDLVLEPSLQSFEFFIADEGPRDCDTVVYRLDLSIPGGPMVASWTVRGQVPFRAGDVAPPSGATATSGPFTPTDIPTARAGWDHAADNIDDAARKLLSTFRERSRIEAYLARRAVGGSFDLPLDGVTLQATVKDLLFDLPGGPVSLVSLGILPVLFRIANGGSRPVPIEALVARLAPAGGEAIGRSGASAVVERLELASTQATEPPALLAGPLAALYWSVRESEKRGLLPGVIAALEEKTLRPGSIAPGQAVEGYFYFALPGHLPPPTGGTVTMNFVDADLHGAALTAPLGGLPVVFAALEPRSTAPKE